MQCVDCADGKYASGEGNDHCDDCPANSNSALGHTVCKVRQLLAALGLSYYASPAALPGRGEHRSLQIAFPLYMLADMAAHTFARAL